MIFLRKSEDAISALIYSMKENTYGSTKAFHIFPMKRVTLQGCHYPIDLWHEIISKHETAYLLQSEAMKQRLLRRQKPPRWGSQLRRFVRSLI